MDFDVKVMDSSFVAPSEPTPRQGLWLSSLDLVLANRGHTPLFYLYHSDGTASDFFHVPKVKEAMAKALVPFFPLAGRLRVNSSGRVEIDCNAEGALFVVARSGITVDEIKDVKPSPELRRQLVPHVEPSSVILAVQGPPFLVSPRAPKNTGPALQTWSAFSRDGDSAAVEPPCHDRSLLRARSPPTVHPDALSTFYPKLVFSDLPRPVASEVFVISKDQVASLKHLCGGASTFCAVSALVWRCVCIARRIPPDSVAHLTVLVNIRRRVRPPLPKRYFGNALVRAVATATVRDITSEALASVADRIRGAIGRVDDELVRSAIDYCEMAGMGSPSSEKGTLSETVLTDTSWLGMPRYDADFGWGKPQVMSRAESNRGGSIHLMSNEQANDVGGVRVLMCMEVANMKEMERLLYEALANVYSRI